MGRLPVLRRIEVGFNSRFGDEKRVVIPPPFALPVGQGSYSPVAAHLVGMHSFEQSQDSDIGIEFEIFSALALAGVQGRVKGVLCDEELLLERRSGHTLHLKLNAINRLRHHHTSLIPRWTLGISFVLLYGAWRVFVGQPALIMLFAGIMTTLVFILGRRPTLVIDTESGDCHTLFANDASLMRMCYLIKRIQGGTTLVAAREGLESLEREADYPSISPLEGSLVAAGEANIDAPRALESFISDNSESELGELLPAWAAKDSGTAMSINEPSYTERISEHLGEYQNTSPRPGSFVPSAIDQGGYESTMPSPFLRAEEVRQEMRSPVHNQIRAPDPWSQPQLPQDSALQTQQYREPQDNCHPKTPESEATFGGFDMFAEGGLFDEQEPSFPARIDSAAPTYQQEPAQQWPQSQPQQAVDDYRHRIPQDEHAFHTPGGMVSGDGGFNSARWQTPDTRPVAQQMNSYRMIEQRAGALPPANDGAMHPDAGAVNQHQKPSAFIPSFLSPLSHGERQDTMMRFAVDEEGEPIQHRPAEPTGIVAAAMKEEADGVYDAELAQNSEAAMQQFPLMQKLAQQRTPSNRRIRMRKQAMGKPQASRGIRNLILPSITKLGKLASAPSRIFKRRRNDGDGYAEVYGDEDGYRDDVFRQERFQTSQSLRLAADQSYQAQIAEEIARLTQANGGVLPDDVAERLLRHIGNSGEGQQLLLTAGPEEIPSSFSDLSSSSEAARKVNDISGIPRLDQSY